MTPPDLPHPAAKSGQASRDDGARGAQGGTIVPFDRPSATARPAGRVAIVGAGPGAADLLTLRALRLLERADAVVYDNLVGPDVLAFVAAKAERTYVGKAAGRHSCSQAEINALLVALAQAGQQVVRLKGGDPAVFGRGGEELEHLLAHGVEVEIVPGVTAATACAAAAGITLTHRDHATAVTFLSGHGKDGEPDVDWAALAQGRQTLVVYMGVGTAAATAARLIAHGLDPATPVAVVERGTLADERILTGSLAGLGALVAERAVAAPALIVIGEVARAAKALPGAVLAPPPRAAAE